MTHRAKLPCVLAPVARELADREVIAPAQPRRSIRPRRAREPQGECSAQQLCPKLIGRKRALLAVEAVHVPAAANKADRRLGGQHLKYGEHDLAWQRKRNRKS